MALVARVKFIDNYIRIINLSKKVIKNLNKGEDISSDVISIQNLSDDIKMTILELTIIHSDDVILDIRHIYDSIFRLAEGIDRVSRMKDVEMINLQIEILEMLIKELEDMRESVPSRRFLDPEYIFYDYEYFKLENDQKYNALEFQRSTEISKKSYDKILRSIKKSNKNINIFHIDNGVNDNLRKSIDSSNKAVELFGVENNEDIYYYNKKNLDRAAYGTGGRISNKVFDVVMLDPEINLEEQHGLRKEKNRLNYSKPYPHKNGIVVYTIPAYRLYDDLIVDISKYIDDIQILYTPTGAISDIFDIKTTSYLDKQGSNMITIIGRVYNRKSTQDISVDTFKKLKNFKKLFLTNKEWRNLYSDAIEEYYSIDQNKYKIQQFRGYLMDIEELKDYALNSTLLDDKIKEKTSAGRDNKIQPLLPFTIGQIGLMLTSGKLDGIISRDGIDNHVIKGRVVKAPIRTVTNSEDGRVTTVENVETNRVEISMFNSKGEYITLT